MEIEHFFSCPYCSAEISVLLDLSEESAEYTEDCQVCCQPIALSFTSRVGQLQEFDAEIA